MGQRFPVQKLRNYPHLLPNDADIWERFLDSDLSEFIEVEYDVRIGSPGFPLDDENDLTRDIARVLTRRRIDAILHGVQTIYIVEIKPSAGLDAFGQALGYSWLYRREFNPPNFIQPVVLTDNAKPDMEELYANFGVALWLVDPSPLFPA